MSPGLVSVRRTTSGYRNGLSLPSASIPRHDRQPQSWKASSTQCWMQSRTDNVTVEYSLSGVARNHNGDVFGDSGVRSIFVVSNILRTNKLMTSYMIVEYASVSTCCMEQDMLSADQIPFSTMMRWQGFPRQNCVAMFPMTLVWLQINGLQSGQAWLKFANRLSALLAELEKSLRSALYLQLDLQQ